MKKIKNETFQQHTKTYPESVKKGAPGHPLGQPKDPKAPKRHPKLRQMGPQMGRKIGHRRKICLEGVLGPMFARFWPHLGPNLTNVCMNLNFILIGFTAKSSMFSSQAAPDLQPASSWQGRGRRQWA